MWPRATAYALRTYTLSYGQKQGRHYLTSVTESTPTQSKRPTTFIWDNSDAHGVAERRSTDAAFKNKAVYTGDFNGDGRTDLMDSKTCSNGTSVEYRYDYGRVVGETHRMGGILSPRRPPTTPQRMPPSGRRRSMTSTETPPASSWPSTRRTTGGAHAVCPPRPPRLRMGHDGR